MAEVSVIIVTWNSSDVIKACLDSVVTNTPEDLIEIIIIDNNSADSTFFTISNFYYPHLQTFQNNENLGYTKAINQAVKYSTGKRIFLLNPDTVLEGNVIETLNNFLKENPAYGASAPLMLNENGTIQRSVRNFPDYWKMFCEFSLLSYVFPKSNLFGSWKMKYFNYDRNSDVLQPMAAALMINMESIEKSDFMDERYEMFFNDVDLCKKIIDKGKKIRFLIAPRIIHKHGESVKKDKIRMIKIWNRDCTQYFKKHHNYPILLLWLKINLKFSEIIRILFYKISNLL